MWTRRHLLGTVGLTAAGCAAGALGLSTRAQAADLRFAVRRFPVGQPTTVRLVGYDPDRAEADVAVFQAAFDAACEAPPAQRLAARLQAARDAGQTARVLVKPAVNSGNRFPYTASPRSVRAVCAWLREQGASEVIVADMSGPSIGTALALGRSGLASAALAGGADRIVAFDELGWRRYELEAATTFHGHFELTALLGDADFVVNIARASTHKLALLTLSLKNWQGLASGSTRRRTHASPGRSLVDFLAEYALAIKPDLVVIDAGLVNTTGGPDQGLVVPVGAVLVAEDMVAADLVALGLLRWASQRVDGQPRFGRPALLTDPTALLWQAPVIRQAVALGVGVARPEELLLSTQAISAELRGRLRADLDRVA